jgi:hypothetical protein
LPADKSRKSFHPFRKGRDESFFDWKTGENQRLHRKTPGGTVLAE